MEEFKETASYSVVAVFKECKKEKLKRVKKREWRAWSQTCNRWQPHRNRPVSFMSKLKEKYTVVFGNYPTRLGMRRVWQTHTCLLNRKEENRQVRHHKTKKKKSVVLHFKEKMHFSGMQSHSFWLTTCLNMIVMQSISSAFFISTPWWKICVNAAIVFRCCYIRIREAFKTERTDRITSQLVSLLHCHCVFCLWRHTIVCHINKQKWYLKNAFQISPLETARIGAPVGNASLRKKGEAIFIGGTNTSPETEPPPNVVFCSNWVLFL